MPLCMTESNLREAGSEWASKHGRSREDLVSSCEASGYSSIEDWLKDDTLDADLTCDGGVVYSDRFLSQHFRAVKISHNDLKSLSLDFTDQTLGGHRIYREETIYGQPAKTYQYTIKVIKFCNDGSSRHGSKMLGLMAENNMLVPNKDLLDALKLAHPKNPSSQKRGRPRKYPVGLEPYKLRKKPPKCPQGSVSIRDSTGSRIYEIEDAQRPAEPYNSRQYSVSEETMSMLRNSTDEDGCTDKYLRRGVDERDVHHEKEELEEWRKQIFRDFF